MSLFLPAVVVLVIVAVIVVVAVVSVASALVVSVVLLLSSCLLSKQLFLAVIHAVVEFRCYHHCCFNCRCRCCPWTSYIIAAAVGCLLLMLF